MVLPKAKTKCDDESGIAKMALRVAAYLASPRQINGLKTRNRLPDAETDAICGGFSLVKEDRKLHHCQQHHTVLFCPN